MRSWAFWSCLLASAAGVACGVDEIAPSRALRISSSETPAPASCTAGGSAFEAITARLLEAHGCAAGACHGRQAAAGLSLLAPDAYGALVNVTARTGGMKRVAPFAPDASYLYLKLKAATEPGSVAIAGSPMPVGAPPLCREELEALRTWISAGAPRASVDEPPELAERVRELLCACGADAKVDLDGPLAPPDRERGVQLRMPPLVARPDSEWEGCVATYYDLSETVPARFRSAAGDVFYVQATEMRLSSGSHHLTIMPSNLAPERVRDPAFGAWSCKGGTNDGARCDPLDARACGVEGVCSSAPRPGVACFGHGPFGTFLNPSVFGLGKSGQRYLHVEAIPGVYRKVATRGIIFWNLHAFNLTSDPRVQTAELNLHYTDDLRYPEQNLSLSTPGYEGIPPFTKRDVCGTWRAPRGSTLFRLSSHTHRHGERFWMTDPAGKLIYESRDYRDPAYLALDPPIVFDARDPAARTIRYCATFNNGVKPDGSPDPELVTRLSRIPSYALTRCTPTACAAGKVGAPCRGASDHARCDTAEARGDGLCDACPIVAGETTEHEMFVMHPDYVPTVVR